MNPSRVSNPSIVSDIALQLFGPHCRILGSGYVERTQTAVIKGISVKDLLNATDGGEDFSWQFSVQIIYYAAAATWTIIQIYDKLRQKKQRAPSERELVESVQIEKIEETICITPVKTELRRIVTLVHKMKTD